MSTNAQQVFALFRTFLFAATFQLFVAILMPWWLRPKGIQFDFFAWDWTRGIAWPVMAVGIFIMCLCSFDFAFHGRGTPAPFDPPRFLVQRDLYRWVRNPMYLGLFVMVTGEAILYEPWRNAVLLYVAFLIGLLIVWVPLYEETTLTRKFGDSYREYCATVPRWIPRRPKPRS